MKELLEMQDKLVAEIRKRHGWNPNILDLCRAANHEIREIENEMQWKWWKIYKEEVNKDKTKEEVIDLLHFVLNMCQALDMDEKEIKEIFRKKHEINMARQKNNY